MQHPEGEEHWNDGAEGGPGAEGETESDAREDGELIRRLREGEGQALRELMDRYDRLVRYAVFRICRSQCVQDPAFLDSRASETWTGFVRSVSRRGRPLPDNLRTYLIQIARNKCADALRQQGQSVSMEGDASTEGLGEVEAPFTASLELLIRAEEVLALRECIEKLSPEEKRICEEMDDLVSGRWTLAGEVLGMPESTVRSKWAAIVGKLKACLEKKIGKSLAPGPPSGDS